MEIYSGTIKSTTIKLILNSIFLNIVRTQKMSRNGRNDNFNAQLVEDLTIRATYHNQLGLFYYKRGKYKKALKNFEAALWIADRLEDLDGKITYLNNIGGVHKLLGNNEEALKQFQAIIKIAKKRGDMSLEATYLNRMGLIYHEEGTRLKESEQFKESLKQFKEAMKCYVTSLKIAEQLEDQNKKVIAINNVAGIYNAQGNYPKAMKYYEDALDLLNEMGLKESTEAKRIEKNIETLKRLLLSKGKIDEKYRADLSENPKPAKRQSP